MSNTKPSRRPTPAQLNFCRVLGVDVDVADTVSDVSAKIARAKGTIATRLVKNSGIRPSSIVRKAGSTDPRLRVVVRIGIDRTYARFVQGGRNESFNTVCYPDGQPPVLAIAEVFPPPQGWLHSYAVRLERDGFETDDLARSREDFIAFVRKNLAVDEQQTLEYGIYWRQDAVDRLRAQFIARSGL